jgi:seryl-tRNA synthetase
MLDLKFIRENKDLVEQGIKNKGYDCNLDELIELDEQRRELLVKAETLKADRNKASDEIGVLKKEGKDISPKIGDLKELSDNIKDFDEKIANIEKNIKLRSLYIPNIPNEEVPIGDESANKEIKTWGEKPVYDFTPKTHVEIAEELDIIDFKRAVKISGAGFALYKKQGAKLERALINFMLDLHVEEHGYTEVSPPFVVNSETMTGTGQLPKMADDMYKLENDDLYLVPTAEVPVTNIFRNEILEQKDLPLGFCAYTPCFRKEAGAYGKDTRGLIRMHQFDKVELVRFVDPEKSYDELELLLSHAETVLQKLGLHYRVIILASKDLSFSAAKCYDIELWAPGQNAYLEVSSCSNFENFQARRMSIRFKDKTTNKTEFVHTINGSGLALARLVVAILEVYQQADGKIKIPDALKPYLNNKEFLI